MQYRKSQQSPKVKHHEHLVDNQRMFKCVLAVVQQSVNIVPVGDEGWMIRIFSNDFGNRRHRRLFHATNFFPFSNQFPCDAAIFIIEFWYSWYSYRKSGLWNIVIIRPQFEWPPLKRDFKIDYRSKKNVERLSKMCLYFVRNCITHRNSNRKKWRHVWSKSIENKTKTRSSCVRIDDIRLGRCKVSGMFLFGITSLTFPGLTTSVS